MFKITWWGLRCHKFLPLEMHFAVDISIEFVFSWPKVTWDCNHVDEKLTAAYQCWVKIYHATDTAPWEFCFNGEDLARPYSLWCFAFHPLSSTQVPNCRGWHDSWRSSSQMGTEGPLLLKVESVSLHCHVFSCLHSLFVEVKLNEIANVCWLLSHHPPFFSIFIQLRLGPSHYKPLWNMLPTFLPPPFLYHLTPLPLSTAPSIHRSHSHSCICALSSHSLSWTA